MTSHCFLSSSICLPSAGRRPDVGESRCEPALQVQPWRAATGRLLRHSGKASISISCPEVSIARPSPNPSSIGLDGTVLARESSSSSPKAESPTARSCSRAWRPSARYSPHLALADEQQRLRRRSLSLLSPISL
ncbi:hypothetical protein ACQJBY_038996 [Aegilops geniculata]